MFGKEKPNRTSGSLLMTTTDVVPGHTHELLGFISGGPNQSQEKATKELQQEAQALGADAIVGVRINAFAREMFPNYIVYGTAVRLNAD